MKKLLIAALFAFPHMTAFANAQETDGKDMDVCATAPDDLLVGLEGRWNLRQGPGRVGRIPLPPRGGHRLILKYDEKRGVLIGSDQEGGEMLMMPVTGEGVVIPEEGKRAAERLFGNDLLKEQDPANCRFYSLPLIFGTNKYKLSSPGKYRYSTNSDAARYMMQEMKRLGTEDAHAKTFLALYLTRCVSRLGREFTGPEMKDRHELTTEHWNFVKKFCARIPDAKEGELVRYLFLRFSSPNTGSGMLYFEMVLDGIKSEAAIPVTISR